MCTLQGNTTEVPLLVLGDAAAEVSLVSQVAWGEQPNLQSGNVDLCGSEQCIDSVALGTPLLVRPTDLWVQGYAESVSGHVLLFCVFFVLFFDFLAFTLLFHTGQRLIKLKLLRASLSSRAPVMTCST